MAVAQGTEVYNADSSPVVARGYEYTRADLDAARATAIHVVPGKLSRMQRVIDEATFLTALEAALKVLQPVGGTDFEALENLRQLAFVDVVPEPEQLRLFVEKAEGAGGEDKMEE